MADVRIREVGPRDGFQNEPEIIPTDDKVRLIDMLARTGLRRLEITSFVRADVIPQLADAADVLRAVDIPDGVARSVLIPNEKGLEKALEHRDPLQDLGAVGELRDHVRAHEAGHLQPAQPGPRELVDQAHLVRGGDDLRLVLEPVARADLADPDVCHGVAI